MRKSFTNAQKGYIAAMSAMAFTGFENAVNSTCLPQIYETFPQTSEFIKSYVVSGPFLTLLPLILFVSKITQYIDRKRVMLVLLLLDFLGSALCAFSVNMVMYAVCRSISGFASGAESALMFGMLFELFPDEKESSRALGYVQAFHMAVSSLMGVLAGMLCLIHWRAACLLNSLGLIGVILTAVFIPEKTPEKKLQNRIELSVVEDNIKPEINNLKIGLTLLKAAVFIVMTFIFTYFQALYIAERNMGSSVLAGIVQAAIILGGSFSMLFLDRLYRRFGRYLGIVCSSVSATCLFLIGGFHVPAWFLIILAFINGCCNSLLGAYYMLPINQSIPASKNYLYQSIYNFVTIPMYSVCSFVPGVLMSIFGGGYQKAILIDSLIYFAFILIFTLIVRFYINRKPS